MIIQYLFLDELYEDGEDIPLLLMISFGLTLVGLLASIVAFVIKTLNFLIDYGITNAVGTVTEYELKLTLQSQKFQWQHAYIHKIVETNLLKILTKYDKMKIHNKKSNSINDTPATLETENTSLWTDRKDTYISCNVFYIENDIQQCKSIYIYLNVFLHCYSNNNNHIDMVNNKLNEIFTSLPKKGSFIYKEFLNLVQKSTHCPRIKLEELTIIHSQTENINKKQKNSVVLAPVVALGRKLSPDGKKGVNNNVNSSGQRLHPQFGQQKVATREQSLTPTIESTGGSVSASEAGRIFGSAHGQGNSNYSNYSNYNLNSFNQIGYPNQFDLQNNMNMIIASQSSLGLETQMRTGMGMNTGIGMDYNNTKLNQGNGIIGINSYFNSNNNNSNNNYNGRMNQGVVLTPSMVSVASASDNLSMEDIGPGRQTPDFRD